MPVIHSFILVSYIVPLEETYSGELPSPATTKEKGRLGWSVIMNGRSFLVEGAHNWEWLCHISTSILSHYSQCRAKFLLRTRTKRHRIRVR